MLALNQVFTLARGARLSMLMTMAASADPGGTTTLAGLATAVERPANRHPSPGTGLEIIAAAESVDTLLVQAKLAQYRASLPADHAVEARHTTLVGGNAEQGRMKFQTGGDCLRCHAVDGQGGNAGPDLAGIASAHNERYLLEALVTPESAIAAGFGHVSLVMKDGNTVSGIMVGETDEHISLRAHSAHGEGGPTTIAKSDIRSRDGPVSGMPAMGLVLSNADVRDVMAYLKTLK